MELTSCLIRVRIDLRRSTSSIKFHSSVRSSMRTPFPFFLFFSFFYFFFIDADPVRVSVRLFVFCFDWVNIGGRRGRKRRRREKKNRRRKRRVRRYPRQCFHQVGSTEPNNGITKFRNHNYDIPLPRKISFFLFHISRTQIQFSTEILKSFDIL